MEDDNSGLPEEVLKKLDTFKDSLDEVQEGLKPFLKIPITDTREKLEDPLQNAKLDLMVAYTTNSLFWTYLITQGIDPKSHPIKDELLRIKKYISKIQLLQDKKKMARIDTSAAKRFVRNALWKPSEKYRESKEIQDEEEATNDIESQEDATEEPETTSTSKSKKRKKQDDTQKKKKKKKKKVNS